MNCYVGEQKVSIMVCSSWFVRAFAKEGSKTEDGERKSKSETGRYRERERQSERDTRRREMDGEIDRNETYEKAWNR